MRRTDPLARRVLAYSRSWDMLPRGAAVLCAVSGGRDSMVLLHLLSTLGAEEGLQVAAAHFNHRLRPTADRDEAFVRDWCRERGIPLTCGAGDVRAFAAREGLGIEDAARRLRYRFLEEAADELGAARIATAHHREDNAETVLLHLLRGSGMGGLCGIPPVRGRIVRPLLEAGREDIDAYAARWSVPHVEDETNADPAYTRNRLRLEVMPLLEEISPGCAGRIAAAGSLLREEEAYLQGQAERAVSISHGLGKETLTGVWDAGAVIGRRIIRAAARRSGVELTRAQTEAVLALRSGGCLDLPGGLWALRESRQLTLKKQPQLPPPLELHEGEQAWGPWRAALERRRAPVEEGPDRVVLRDLGGRLAIAAWDGRGRLAVENGSRTIKRLFVDKKIPVERRWEHPALYLDGKAVAVFGVAVDWALRPRPGDPCLIVTLRTLQR